MDPLLNSDHCHHSEFLHRNTSFQNLTLPPSSLTITLISPASDSRFYNFEHVKDMYKQLKFLPMCRYKIMRHAIYCYINSASLSILNMAPIENDGPREQGVLEQEEKKDDCSLISIPIICHMSNLSIT
jgi:hypothetical protein